MLPSEKVIEKCGGSTALSAWLNLSRSTVLRWTYPPSRGGTGGHIPAKYMQPILARAAVEGRALSIEDFFPIGKAQADAEPQRASA